MDFLKRNELSFKVDHIFEEFVYHGLYLFLLLVVLSVDCVELALELLTNSVDLFLVGGAADEFTEIEDGRLVKPGFFFAGDEVDVVYTEFVFIQVAVMLPVVFLKHEVLVFELADPQFQGIQLCLVRFFLELKLSAELSDLLFVQLLHLAESRHTYITCMNDWCAFYFSAVICCCISALGNYMHFD